MGLPLNIGLIEDQSNMGDAGNVVLRVVNRKNYILARRTQQVTYEYIKGKNYILYQAILKIPLTKDVLQALHEKKK